MGEGLGQRQRQMRRQGIDEQQVGMAPLLLQLLEQERRGGHPHLQNHHFPQLWLSSWHRPDLWRTDRLR
jgi:hypothetical protein